MEPPLSEPRPASATDRLAFALSAIASPFVVLPFYTTILIRHFLHARGPWGLWVVIALGGMVGVPLVYILIGVRRGRLTDIHLRELEQRRGPLLAALVGAALAALGLRWTNAPLAIQLGPAAVVVNGLIFFAISLRWKISIHPGTLAACTVLCGMIDSPWWFIGLAAVPPVAWARVRRRRHNWPQGVAAALLSALLTAAMVLIYFRLGVD